ncbi:hypothetical protein ACVGV7_00750, partial [Enterobacter intestinihominis]
VVRSGALTPALSHRATGQTIKNATTLPFFFYLPQSLNPTNTNTNHNGRSIADRGISYIVDISTTLI